MQPIPMPEILDPDRIISTNRDSEHLGDPRDHDLQLTDALHDSCTYAQQLWHTLAATRTYLHDGLPPDTDAPAAHPDGTAFPIGPRDEDAWNQWISTYASITSTLAGPNGDEGFGLDEAKHAARQRRNAPASTAPAPSATPLPNHSQPVHVTTRADARPTSLSSPARRKLRTAMTVALTVLALRGLRRWREPGVVNQSLTIGGVKFFPLFPRCQFVDGSSLGIGQLPDVPGDLGAESARQLLDQRCDWIGVVQELPAIADRGDSRLGGPGNSQTVSVT